MSGYIGVSNTARKIKSLYVGVNGVARKVNSAYIGVNGIARKWYSSALPPSTEYEDKNLGTWSSTSDVDTFFTTHNYYNGWSGLKIGNYVTIRDGTYNKKWVIAGFNTETASDGTPGGIVFIPRYVNLIERGWAQRDVPSGYKDSYTHTYVDGVIKSSLSTILGSHIVQRNVTLGSEYNTSTWSTTASTNTTAHLTLMSAGQLDGTFGTRTNSYDDGEADYKLPLFNFITTKTYGNDTSFWLRNLWGKDGNYLYAWYTNGVTGSIYKHHATSYEGFRPLMYLR